MSKSSVLKAKTHFFKKQDLSIVLEGTGTSSEFTGTKIMATMGPSIHDVDILAEVLEAGMTAGRV
ncbi:pyruvate kinase, partial [Haematococcus lacustris]